MKYDLLIQHGEVLDPGGRACAACMDVGIAGGKIVEVGAVAAARRRRAARSAPRAAGHAGADRHPRPCLRQRARHGRAVPTSSARRAASPRLCDAGSTGSATFAGLRHVLDHEVRTRVRAFVNLSAIGIVGTSRGGELSHFPYADPEGCARTIIENPDLAIGVKLRYGPGLVWEYTTEPVKMARRTAAMAGVPLMIHITDSPIPLPEILGRDGAGRHRHPLLSRPRQRHHGPGEAARAEGGGRGAAPRHRLRLRPWPQPFQLPR